MLKSLVIKDQGDSFVVDQLANDLHINHAIAILLVQRGIKTFKEAKSFFRPVLSQLHDPFLMKDMDAAVNRLNKAIANGEKIMIYGDYDVDGTTSVALVYSFLSERYKNLDYYIPDRYTEGYGISIKGIDHAYANKISLIIALDCGIKSMEKINYAKEREIDFIICDHHTAGEKIPEAFAVLDPKRMDCSYPYKDLSGCAVGFKFMQAYAISNNIPFDTLFPYLDLVAVSIASDIVPITGENRVLAYFGLKQLNLSPRDGLKAIIKVSGIENKEIELNDVVFKIGPRINAAGRIESGKSSVELLISTNKVIATEMGDLINDYNNTRRNIDSLITKEALQLIAESKDLLNRNTTVIYNPNWHKGVVGIVASRLTETYFRPTVVLTESNGFISGSARSVPGFDLYHAIEMCSHLLENFGGHMYAAGLTMKKENYAAFSQKFEEAVSETILKEQLIPVVEVDTVIELSDITPDFYNELKQFQPFGPENLPPVFLTENVADNGSGRIVGNDKEHLKLNLIQEKDPFREFPAIGFNMASYYNYVSQGHTFDICYHIEENVFMGNTQLQLRIKDIKKD